ncbi:MAG: OmpA family protein [Verrucomicrobia bacterium]|nr:OmpA family protein [Verrucomicrobiota bacterium]
MPLDGRCPECGQPLVVESLARRRLKFIPPLLFIALLAVGGYYGWKYFIAPSPGGGGTTDGRTLGGGGQSSRTNDPNNQEGALRNPNFRVEDEENARARREVLARIERMPRLTPQQKSKLTASVDTAKSMGMIIIIPFEAGKNSLGPRETDILVKATQNPSIQRLTDDPTLVLVVLGFADRGGDPKQNLEASIQRAESVQTALRDRCNIQNVTYAVGMGGSDLIDPNIAAKNRRVEIWAVFP